MRVVLFESVSNLGLAGEIVDVKPGYFRNYLEPRQLALRESPQTLRLLASKRKKIEQALLREKSQAEAVCGAIAAITLTFTLKAGEHGRLFGSVTSRDVADALKTKGVEVDRHKIELPESIKSVGHHTARIRLYPEVVAELGIIVEAEKKSEEEIAAEQEAAEGRGRRRGRRKAQESSEEAGEAAQASADGSAAPSESLSAPASEPNGEPDGSDKA